METRQNSPNTNRENLLFDARVGAGGQSNSRLNKVISLLLLLLLAGLLYLFIIQGPTTIEAGHSIIEHQLNDGSFVSLNRHSSLTYTDNYGDHSRKVVLKGEGFFEIQRDPAKPFTVITNTLKMQVHGTSFYINTNQHESSTIVIAKRGKVVVIPDWENNKKVHLQSGEKGIFSSETPPSIQKGNPSPNYLSWKTKKFNFQNLELIEVVRALNNAYGDLVILKDNELRNCTLTIAFDKQSLMEIINALQRKLSLEVTRKDNKIVLSGRGC